MPHSTTQNPPQDTTPHDPHVQVISFDAPLRWLQLGFSDMRRAGWLSYLHGVILAVGGLTIAAIAYQHFWLLAAAASGFLVIAPVLATSLYAISRALQQGQDVDVRLLQNTWLSWQTTHRNDPNGYWCLVRFGILLALAGTGWVLTSAALTTLLSPHPIVTPLDFLRHIVVGKDNYVFELWLLLGALMTAPIFASSVVTMPLLLDKRITMQQAVSVSWQTVLANPGPLALWATILMALTGLGFLTLFLGFIFITPLLGHASWHAYQDLVDTRALTPRDAPTTSSKGA